MVEPQRKTTCGIVGCGRIGKLYGRLLADDKSQSALVLTAAADPQSKLSDPAIPHFHDFRDLLGTTVEAVIIATPPDLHYSMAREALEAGKHVAVEKPPTRTPAQAEELIDLARRRRLTLFFSYHARYNHCVRSSREALAGSRIRRIEVTYHENVSHYHDPGSWVFREGVLRDSGINVLSVLTHVVPGAASLDITAAEFRTSGSEKVVTQANLVLTLNDRNVGSLSLDWIHPGREVREIVITSDQGAFSIDIVTDRLLRDGHVMSSGDCPDDRLTCEYRAMLADFATHINTGQSSAGTAELRLIATAERVGGWVADTQPPIV